MSATKSQVLLRSESLGIVAGLKKQGKKRNLTKFGFIKASKKKVTLKRTVKRDKPHPRGMLYHPAFNGL